MNVQQRRAKILALLKDAQVPVSASALAERLCVSRQIIVGDVALLRASGSHISATPRGYVYEKPEATQAFPFEGTLACKHTSEQLKEELYTIVDFGGYIFDVIIDHPLYGQIAGQLNIASRHDVDLFLEKITVENNARPLSALTGGIHLHRVGCRDKNTFSLIRNALEAKGIAL